MDNARGSKDEITSLYAENGRIHNQERSRLSYGIMNGTKLFSKTGYKRTIFFTEPAPDVLKWIFATLDGETELPAV
jgi:hypothetical protein